MTWLELKYLNLLSGGFRNFRRVSEREYNFSCPICGDSKKNPRKARGYLYDRNGSTQFHCHNCSRTLRFHNFLRTVDPSLYEDYQLERISTGEWTPTSQRRQAEPKLLPLKRKESPTDNPLRQLIKVTDLKSTHRAKALLSERKIPILLWPTLYHCPLFRCWVHSFHPEQFKGAVPERDEPRLIIPFLDKNKRLISLQGRSYEKKDSIKYVTIRLDESLPRIYGLERFDPGSKGYGLEGPFDSMFLPNALAFAGGDHGALGGFCSQDKTVLVYDNEPRSPDTRRKMEKAVREGWQVCVWPEWIAQKDVNQMVQEGVSPSVVKDIIDQNTFSGLGAEVEIARWSKS